MFPVPGSQFPVEPFEPGTRNPELETRNPEPGTLPQAAEPGTGNPEPRPVGRLLAIAVAVGVLAVSSWNIAFGAGTSTLGTWNWEPGTPPQSDATSNREPGTRNSAAGGQNSAAGGQVLVLYNADWTDDAPLTDPGQDSKEVAEHYVRMHTDPATGEKPSVLGLRCVHGAGHLNQHHLAEGSTDNGSGVVLRRGGRVLGSAGEMRDSRAMEFTLPKNEAGWRFETLRLELKPNQGDPLFLVEAGQSAAGKAVAVQPEGDWNVRADARRFRTGRLLARARCLDGNGEEQRWEAEYQDVLDISCSRTGADGVRDDQNFLDDVETPVKAFLEDPANARPDGTLLKDHVLFLVVAYGLPRTAVAAYGIARGITELRSNHGAIIDLGQRLQVMYYDLEGVQGFAPKPHRFKSEGGFSDYLFRAPQTWPLSSSRANPFAHPLVYAKEKGALDQLPEPVPFTGENRGRFPGKFLYFSTRVDGLTPLEARGLVDRAVYASLYGGPQMGILNGRDYPETEAKLGKTHYVGRQVGRWLWDRGFRHLRVNGGSRGLVWLDYLLPDEGFLNSTPVFLPGGISGTVRSNNSWNRKDGPLVLDLARGATVTAGAAQSYGGAPHIHDKSWWDDEILHPFLSRGRSVGEALLMNQVELAWITAFVGDPLCRWPSSGAPDECPPEFDPDRDVHVRTHKSRNGERAVWLQIDLDSTPARPETAQLRAISDDGREALCQTFEARPYLVMGKAEEVCDRMWSLEMLDPFGNRFRTSVRARAEDCR
ncbi:MAG: hypothetical protein P1P84_12330 [Deferrisomatales bacterium]|nr:hypothetical protein [Deferrisomatales bacterium]